MKVLFIGIHARIRRAVLKGLEGTGLSSESYEDPGAGLDRLTEIAFDAAVVAFDRCEDFGRSVADGVRARDGRVPVLAAVGPHADPQAVSEFVDDWVSSPFDEAELAVRLSRAIAAKRAEPLPPVVTRVHRLELDTDSAEARHAGKSVHLTRREAAFLRRLMESPGRVVTRATLLSEVWGIDFDPDTNRVDVTAMRLRRKLARIGAAESIETIRGQGFRVCPAYALKPWNSACTAMGA